MAINLNTEANAVDKKIIAHLTTIGLSSDDFDTNFTIKGKDRPDVAIKNKEKKYCIIFENKKDFKDLHGAKGQGLNYLHQLKDEGLLADKILLVRTNMITFHADEFIFNKGNSSRQKDINIDMIGDINMDFIKKYTHPVKIEETKLLSTDKQELKKAFDGINNFLRGKGLGIDQRLHITMAMLFLKLIKENTDLLDSIVQSSEKKDLLAELENIKSNISEKNITNVFEAINKVYNKEFRFDLEQYKEKKVLTELFDIVDKVHLSNYDLDIKGEAFEYFINYGNTSSDMGEYFTPRHIVKFMVNLLDQAFEYNRERFFGKTYFDPTCGTGGFLIEIFKHIKNELKKTKNLNEKTEKILKENTVFGNELNLRSSEIAKMNMILTGDGHSNIDQGDFLSLKDEKKNTYDVTIGNPPFGQNKEREFVDGFLKDVKIGGYAIFLVPEGVLFKADKNFVEIRKILISKGKLLKVVSLPQGVFMPYSGVKTDIIFRKKEQQIEDYDIEFIDIKNDGYSLDANRREIKTSDLMEYFTDKQKLIVNGQVFTVNSSQIYDKTKLNELELEKARGENSIKEFTNKVNTLKKQVKAIQNTNEKSQKNQRIKEIDIEIKKQKEYSKKIDSTLKGFDLSLVVGRYKKGFSTQTTFDKIRLGDVAEYINGFPFKPADRADNGKKIIRIQNLTDGEKKFNFYDKNDIDKKYIIKDGDLLISRSATIGFYVWHGGDAYLNQHIFKVNINESKILKKYFYYLGTKVRQEILKNVHGNTMTHITKGDFENIEIPLPSIEYQQQIISEINEYQKIIDGNKLSLETYKPKIEIKNEWEIVKLANIVEFDPQKSEVKRFNPKTPISFVPMQIIQEHQKYFQPQEDKTIEEVYKGYTYFKDNDVLLAKITPCFENGKSAIAKNLKNAIGFGSTEYFVLRANEKVLPDWIYYFISNEEFIQGGKSFMSGSAGQQRVSKEYILSYKLPLPPLAEQEEIVTQLEEEQKLIDANKRLIEIFEGKIKAKIEQVWNGK